MPPKKLFVITILLLTIISYANQAAMLNQIDKEEEDFLNTIIIEQLKAKNRNVQKEIIKSKKELKSNKIVSIKNQKKSPINKFDINESNITKNKKIVFDGNLPLNIEVDLSEQIMRVLQDKHELYRWKVSTGTKNFPTPTGKFKPEFFKKSHKDDITKKTIMHYAIFFHDSHAIVARNSSQKLGQKNSSTGGVKLKLENARILFDLVINADEDKRIITIVD